MQDNQTRKRALVCRSFFCLGSRIYRTRQAIFASLWKCGTAIMVQKTGAKTNQEKQTLVQRLSTTKTHTYTYVHTQYGLLQRHLWLPYPVIFKVAPYWHICAAFWWIPSHGASWSNHSMWGMIIPPWLGFSLYIHNVCIYIYIYAGIILGMLYTNIN